VTEAASAIATFQHVSGELGSEKAKKSLTRARGCRGHEEEAGRPAIRPKPPPTTYCFLAE
jgi:hypothetical protein